MRRERLIGVLSCYVNNGTHFNQGKNYQIRGVAVVEKLQQKGIGKALMLYAEQLLKTKECNHIWLNARVNASSFYTKLGYLEIGTVFEVPVIGTHQCFYKKIKSMKSNPPSILFSIIQLTPTTCCSGAKFFIIANHVVNWARITRADWRPI